MASVVEFVTNEIVDVLLSDKLKECCQLNMSKDYWIPANFIDLMPNDPTQCIVSFDHVKFFQFPLVHIRKHSLRSLPKEFAFETLHCRTRWLYSIFIACLVLSGFVLFVIFGPFMTKMYTDNAHCHRVNDNIVKIQVITFAIVEHVGYGYVEYSYLDKFERKTFCNITDSVSNQRVGTSVTIVYLFNQPHVCKLERDNLRECDENFKSDIVAIIFMTLLAITSALLVYLASMKYNHVTVQRQRLIIN